jgi:hypothetical protein
MKLHEHADDFRNLVRATAQNLGIREVYVEKDYWLTFMLHRLTLYSKASEVVFKGGTSLSKGYGIIRRFSEDVDLAVVQSSKTNAQVERLIKNTAKVLSEAPFEEVFEVGITSKKGMNRRTLHKYPRLIQDANFGLVRDSLLLEINAFGEPSLSKVMSLCSFAGEFLEKMGQQDAIKEFALEPFEIQILDYRKTFIEKILSLTYASFEDGDSSNRETRARVRHFYDLTQLFAQEDVRSFMQGPEFPTWMQQVRKEEKVSSRTKWLDRALSEARLHREVGKVLSDVKQFFKADLQ